MKKVLHISFWLLLTVGMCVLLSFVNASQSNLVCESLAVDIDYSNGMYFLKQKDVEEILQRTGTNPLGKKLKNVDVQEMERVLTAVPEVERANVFRTINGKVGIRLTQRTPIVRVFNRSGASFYIDDKGYQMPLSANYFPRVPVVTGYIREPFFDKSVFEIAEDSTLKKESLLDDIYAVVQAIQKDEFWNAQFQEIYFNRWQEIELVPIVGQHRIILGDTSNLEGKLNKLMVFYEKGLEQSGWNIYDTINLKFKDQIVCTKKIIKQQQIQ